MAKKNNLTSSSVITNSFIKGMNKDITQSMEPEQSWWNARNAANNSNDGDMGVIGNEPANLQCGVIPYTIIGAIHRYGDEWVVFSTDNFNSEIGRFDDSECKYTTLVNDSCLAFNKKHLITGAAKENFDCTWEVYWDDGNNPSRSLNIDDIPWKQYISSAPGDPCIVYSDIEPRQLNCEKIRLAPLVDTPCLLLSRNVDGGMLKNGAYQVFIAYTENEQRVTDYIGISNIQTLFSHEGTSGSLDVAISNLDKDYDYYEVALLVRNQGQTFAKRIGLYSTETQNVNIDFIDPALINIDLKLIPQRSPAYEKSQAMYVVNDWLLRQGPVEQFDFNYQPIANEIKVNWVVNQLNSNYYSLAGNKLGLLRDEQYAFFIRWIYNTGERSSSYHIPGRAPEYYAPAEAFENEESVNANALANTINEGVDQVFQIWNTGSITSQNLQEVQEDGSLVIARGNMAYWESSEKYPTNRPDIWGDLCGKPIRHHKMPSEEIGGANSPLHISTTSGDLINLLGVEFTNIGKPKNNDGTYITNVVGYEILRGSRLGAKSILAKGIFRNMREYTIPNEENLIGGTVQGLYPNYPYNDLRPDVYFHDGEENSAHLTDGCDGFTNSINTFKPLNGYSKKVFTFSSPDLMFTNPFLNAYETRIYGDVSGKSSGQFIPSEDHPQFKLIRNSSAIVGAIIGLGYAIAQVQGETSQQRSGGKADFSAGGNDWASGGLLGSGVGLSTGAFGANYVSNLAGSVAASALITVGTETYANAFGTASITDLFLGGTALNGLDLALSGVGVSAAAFPTGVSGEFTINQTANTSYSKLPVLFKVAVRGLMNQTNIAIGGNEIIDLIYNLIEKRDFVFKYNSYGFFNKFSKRNNGLWRIKNTDSNYLGQSFQTFNNGDYKINNLFRPSTVAVALDKELQDPEVQDTSRFVIGGSVNSNGIAVQSEDVSLPGQENTNFSYIENPTTPQKKPISAFYGALKFNFDNQYGQLDGIKQIPMRGCVEYLNSELPDQYMYSSSPIFSGDVFITRYTEKVIMPIFSQYLLGQPDNITFDYSSYVNIPYPRYWLSSIRYDLSPIARVIASGGASLIENLFDGPGIGNLLPNDLFYLDRGSNSCGASVLLPGFGNGDPNPKFAMRYAYMYSHSNGILDFFVESEVNLANRDWEDTAAKRIYNVYGYNDVKELFHAQIEKEDNFYKYDESLSPAKFPSQLSTWGNVQPRYYDPYVAENCYISRPKILIYSLQAQHESKKDFWRVFLNFNYKDFKNKVSVIKPMNKNGAIVFFPYLSPQMFQGIDTLKLGSNNNITIGDGKLFSQPFQNIANSDLSNEYGSCESLRSVVNTPQGLFYISQAQGKIFQYGGKGLDGGGKGLDPISNNGMKWWFNKYLPSQLIKQYPLLEQSVLSDNPIVGVGCQTVYDPNNDTVYFMKRDYRVKSEFISEITYTEDSGFLLDRKDKIILGDPLYFDDCSWTISYDPKAKAWISFHDWHPELALPSINHFFTTKTIQTDIPQCPPGYAFNSTTGLCEIILNASERAEVTVIENNATVTGGYETCEVDIVIAMDVSGSTTTNGAKEAQLAWLTSFLDNPAIANPMALGNMQIGFTAWDNGNTNYDIPNPAGGTWSMSNTVTSAQVDSWYNANWTSGETNVGLGLSTGQTRINLKASSQLGDRTGNVGFKQIIILVTDSQGNPGPGIGCPYQAVGVSLNSSGPANQNVFALYCGATSSTPTSPTALGHISCTGGPINVDGYQYGINASDPTTFPVVANAIAANVCGEPISCNCPAGYTLVYLDSASGTYTAASGACKYETPPICRKVTCECPPSLNSNWTTTITGTCDDIYLVGNPTYINPDPQMCNYFYSDITPANYNVGSFWRHNSRCDSFANYYNVSYPWEVELVSNTGQTVNTVRSMEYQLEVYVYKGDMGYACNDDKWEDLNFNFDQSIIYNNEQVSGLLQLTPTPFNEPILELTYPIINLNNINILCSKVEQKYRFNQFWDITNDRGEFTNAEQPIWNTRPNGYIKDLNNINLNYDKSPLQHKKFRHYFTNVILRRMESENRKMLLRLNNSKLLTSLR